MFSKENYSLYIWGHKEHVKRNAFSLVILINVYLLFLITINLKFINRFPYYTAHLIGLVRRFIHISPLTYKSDFSWILLGHKVVNSFKIYLRKLGVEQDGWDRGAVGWTMGERSETWGRAEKVVGGEGWNFYFLKVKIFIISSFRKTP